MISSPAASPSLTSSRLKAHAIALGFDAVGITTLAPNSHAAELDNWLARGYAASMTYLHRQATRRKAPATIWPPARFAVVTLSNYYRDSGKVPAAPRIAQYAQSVDYHRTVGQQLEQLGIRIRELAPGTAVRTYIDAGPIPERELAVQAGLGWVGKNMMHIHPRLGSFTFIGVILTDAELLADLPFEGDRCGSCRRCLDACPTQAFVEPRVLDARRCIAYLTIEHRGAFSQDEQQSVGDWLFGCDVCQDVCPWNEKFASPARDPAPPLPTELASLDAARFEQMDEAEFRTRFGALPFARAGLAGMRRNATAVRANSSVR